VRGQLRALPLLMVLACADDEPSLPCDVRQHACQRAIFRAVAQTRDQQDAEMPPVRVISRDQLADELRSALAESVDEQSEADALLGDQKQRGLALLGLMPEPSTQTADEAYIAQSVATIAAYYSHSSHDVTVIADQAQERDDATITLAHEFVHALQDQREGLGRLQQKYAHSSDEEVAFTSLVEGEATWLSYVTYYRDAQHIDYEALNHQRAFQSILDRTLKAIADSAAPLLDASELLPYPVGGEYVARTHLAQGLPALAARFEDPLLNVRAYVDDDYDDTLPLALTCDPPAAPEGYERISIDRLGFAGLLAFRMTRIQDEQSAFVGTRGWRADQLAIYAIESDEASSAASPDAVAVSWRVRLDSALAAQDFVSVMLRNAPPGSSLNYAVQGGEVAISGASDPSLLATWPAAGSCPQPEKSRAQAAGDSLQARLRRRLGITR
jgi:hypothetical protein